MSKLYASIDGVSGILSVQTTENHGNQISIATVNCISHSLTIGDIVDIYIGYEDDYAKVFSGYLKMIERGVPENTYILTFNDVAVRAADYFIASANPEEPFKRSNILAEDLVGDVLGLAGITNYSYQATSFTFGITTAVEVNLLSSMDFCKSIANILAWNIWGDKDRYIQFRNRKPYVMFGTSGQPGDIADVPLVGKSITNIGLSKNIIDFNYNISEKELRNRVVVYGTTGVFVDARASSPYLPEGFYKTTVVGSTAIDSQNMAEDAASYNLAMLNRLTRRISTRIIGDADLSARNVILVNESRTGINENCYIYSCNHTWSSDGFITSLELRI